ncbi:TPA: hypothetical protein ACF67X_005368 [Salmonella enterica]
MKKYILPVVCVIFSGTLYASTCQQSMKIFSGFTFPLKSDPQTGEVIQIPERACFHGRDVTQWITGSSHDKLNSVLKIPDEELFFVTSYNEQTGNSQMFRVFELSNGNPGKMLILKNDPHVDDPYKTLDGMSLDWYDEENGVVFFSTQAWHTSDAVWSFTLPVDRYEQLTLPVKPHFITDGNFQITFNNTICNKCFAVNKHVIDDDGQGSYFPFYMVDFKGKKICQIDSRIKHWTLEPKCLPKNVIFKPR